MADGGGMSQDRPDDAAGISAFGPGLRLRFTLVYMALFLPFAVATPYLQVLLHKRGFGKEAIGWALGTLEVMAVVAPPLWGCLADRTGRAVRLLFFAALGCIPTFLLFGVVQGTLSAVVAAVLFGMCYRPMIPLTDGITFHHIHSRGGDYGQVRVGGSVAFMLATLVLEAVGIADSEGGRMILFGMTVACMLHVGGISLIPRRECREGLAQTTSPDARGGMRVFLKRPFLTFMLCAFLGRVAMMSYYGFFSLYLRDVHGFPYAGLMWCIGPLSEIPVIYFSRRIMAKIGVRNLFALGLAGCAVRLVGFSLATGLTFVVALQFLHALTFGAYHTASVTYVSRAVPLHLQRSAQTLFAAVTMGGGGLLGGVLGGIVADHFGFTALYACFGGIALLAFCLLLVAVPGLPHCPAGAVTSDPGVRGAGVSRD